MIHILLYYFLELHPPLYSPPNFGVTPSFTVLILGVHHTFTVTCTHYGFHYLPSYSTLLSYTHGPSNYTGLPPSVDLAAVHIVQPFQFASCLLLSPSPTCPCDGFRNIHACPLSVRRRSFGGGGSNISPNGFADCCIMNWVTSAEDTERISDSKGLSGR